MFSYVHFQINRELIIGMLNSAILIFKTMAKEYVWGSEGRDPLIFYLSIRWGEC